MDPLHFQVSQQQSPHTPGRPCGDVVRTLRTPQETFVVVADGLGHGVTAQVAAELTAARLLGSLHRGASSREAFGRVVTTLQRGRGHDPLYTAFSLVRCRRDGEVTVLAYEAPAPILASGSVVAPLPGRTTLEAGALVREVCVRLGPGDSLTLLSDGISQAGLGTTLREGWTEAGVARLLAQCRHNGYGPDEQAERIHRQARRHWGTVAGDDCTVVVLSARLAQRVNLFTGPAARRGDDAHMVHSFLSAPGTHLVCGGTSAQIVARHLGVPLRVEREAGFSVAPPRCFIEGVDLVTEGAVTLNQVHNIWDLPIDQLEPNTGVALLAEHLHAADELRIFLGHAPSPTAEDLACRQLGLLPRERILGRLAERLEAQGTLVVIDSY